MIVFSVHLIKMAHINAFLHRLQLKNSTSFGRSGARPVTPATLAIVLFPTIVF
jgi:hypothetical protein